MTAEEQLQYLNSYEAVACAQDYLAQALRLDAQISLKLAQLDALREKKNKLCHSLGIPPDKLPADEDIRGREAAVLADYSALLRLQSAIADHVGRVPDAIQRAVLEMRYLQGAPFFRIAMALHYDERHIYRLHRSGLRHVAAQLMQEGRLPPYAHDGGNAP